MKPRVYVLDREDVGYGERYVYAYLSWRAHRRVVSVPSFPDFCSYMEVPASSVRNIINRLEEKGFIRAERKNARRGKTIRRIELKVPRGERLIKVPLGFLFVRGLKERGLLLTLVKRAVPEKAGEKVFYYCSFHLDDLFTEDARDERTIRKMLRNLAKRKTIEIEKTRPYYVVEVRV